MQQRTTGGADPMGQLPDPLSSPTEFLLAFLNRVAMVDKEGFFQRPVREEEAPNYYSIIKQPMCFGDIRDKISSGSYQTWRQLRDDFNLIHENAKKFNSNKTLVHRAALNLQKKGTQILAQFELQVRKALAVLHPLGAEQPTGPAATGQTNPSDASAMAVDVRIDFAASPSANTSISVMALAPEQNSDGMALDGGCQRPTLSGPPSPEGADGGNTAVVGLAPGVSQVPQSFPSVLLSPAPRDPLVGYISDDEDQPVLVVGRDAAAVAVASAASRSLVGLGPSCALPLDGLLTQLRSTAVRVPYGSVGRQRKEDVRKCSSGSGRESPVDAGPSMGIAASTSKEWRKARRPVELKGRWLEMRMRELRSQKERLQAQINWLQQRKAAGDEGLTGAALAAGMGKPALGVLIAAAGLAAAPCTSEREALASTAGEFMSAGRVSSSLFFRLLALSTPGRGIVATNASLPAGASAVSGPAGAEGGPQVGADLPARTSSRLSPDVVEPACRSSDQQISASPSPASEPGLAARDEDLRRAMAAPTPSQIGQPQQASLGQRQQGVGQQAVQPPLLLPQQQAPYDEAEADKMVPGAIFASLDLLEQRLSVVHVRLQESYKFDSNRLLVGRTQGPYASRAPSFQLASSVSLAAPGTAAGSQPVLSSGPSGGQGAVKRQSSGQGRRPGGLTVLTRFDSMGMPSCKSTGGGKRKRSEIELLTGDICTPLASYGRTSLDRSASVTTIVIPPVRELASDEFRARVVAATTWSQHYHTIGPSALDTIPHEIQAVLRKRRRRGFCASGDENDEEMGMGPGGSRILPGASDDEGGGLLASGMGGLGGPMSVYSDSGMGDDEGSSTSSEDTSDEAYAARHRIMEEEEHRRYAAVVAEGQRRRNKGGNNASGSQQNQGGVSSSVAGGGTASQAKERAKMGYKTPRYSNSFKLKEGPMLMPPELPSDGPDMILPSATYGYYQPYQPPMVGIPMASTIPPTPGSTPAAVLAQPQPVVVQQAVAQRTASPPAMLHLSPSGAQGQYAHRPLVASSTLTAVQPMAAIANLPTAAAAVGAGRPPVSQIQPHPLQQGQQNHAKQATPQHAGAVPENVPAVLVVPTVPLQQQFQAQPQGPQPVQDQAQPPASPHAQPQAQPQGHVHQHQQQQPQTAPLTEAQQQVQQQPSSLGRQQEKAANNPIAEQQQQQRQQEEGQHAKTSQQPQQQAEVPQQPSGSCGEQTSVVPDHVKPPAESLSASSNHGDASSKSSEASEAAAQPDAIAAPPKLPSPKPNDEALQAEPTLPSSAVGQQQCGVTLDPALAATPASAAGGNSANVAPAAPVHTAAAAETQLAVAASGNTAAASALTSSAQAQAQQVAMSVGASALLSNQAAAAMIAQSPAMSMQFLTGMQGLGGAAGAGGSSNSLSAAATSILLAAAAAASAGGQTAANNLMGNARTSALQQLAAGAPAAQVFANAAAAAAAAAAAGTSAGAGAAVTLGGLGQHGKQQSLFGTGATGRGMPANNPLTAAATMSGIGGLGGIAGLPAAFQTLQGFPQSLAGVTGFNLNLAGSGVGLGLQAGQRLPDSLIGLGVMQHGAQHLQAHHLQGMPATAAAQRQGQQMGQAEGGRGTGRGRRASRTTVVEEDDEEWDDDDEEDEEAASPNARTRRSTRAQRRGSNGMRGADAHGNGGPEAVTRQSKRRAAKGAHNWAVLLASDSSDEDDGDEEWGSRGGRRPQEGARGRGRGRRSAG